MPDQESTQGFIRLTYYQGLLIAGGFTLVGGLIGAWLNHYFADRRNKTERYNTAYDDFAKAFTPALHRLDNPEERADDIIREEFPKHKFAFFNFEHIIRGSKNEIIFKEKWKEYDAKQERIYKHVWSGAPASDFPELLESDGHRAKDFNQILKIIIEELLQIAKNKNRSVHKITFKEVVNMMRPSLVLFLIFGSLFVINISLAAEQKMLFNVESISYRKDTGSFTCQRECTTKYNDPPLEEMLKQGWRIISSSPKEAIGSEYWSISPSRYSSGSYYGCTCKGTQYVLQKDDQTPAPPAVPSPNEELLKKENELLKRENELLKKENDDLKAKLKEKQKKK